MQTEESQRPFVLLPKCKDDVEYLVNVLHPQQLLLNNRIIKGEHYIDNIDYLIANQYSYLDFRKQVKEGVHTMLLDFVTDDAEDFKKHLIHKYTQDIKLMMGTLSNLMFSEN